MCLGPPPFPPPRQGPGVHATHPRAVVTSRRTPEKANHSAENPVGTQKGRSESTALRWPSDRFINCTVVVVRALLRMALGRQGTAGSERSS